MVEAAWTYQHRPSLGPRLRKRQSGLPGEVVEIAWKAQQWLHQRFEKLAKKGKNRNQVVTAVARELLGFVWAVAVQSEARFAKPCVHAA